MEKKLSSLLSALQDWSYELNDGTDPLVNALVYDSRAVKPGSLYFAWPGVHVHGNTFIAKAIAAGAAAVIFQDELPADALDAARTATVPLIRVKDSRHAMSPAAAAFYDDPSSKLAVIGITGTEGKSTTVYLVWQLLRMCGKKAGFISTVNYSLGGDAMANPEHQTTPEATVVQEKLYQMVENGCEYAVVESSSHGLSLLTSRLADVRFDAGIMMNVTHEHLEFHGTFEQYRHDKANLFRALDRELNGCSPENKAVRTMTHTKTILGIKREVPAFGIVNLEDPSAAYFQEATKCPVYGYTTFGRAGAGAGKGGVKLPDFKMKDDCAWMSAHDIVTDSEGVTFRIENNGINQVAPGCHMRINLPGTFNVYNTMAAVIAVSVLLGRNASEQRDNVEKLLPVKGRMTTISRGQPFEVIVDYAHTPSSFNTIFPPLRERITAAGKNGRMICLFGSGGERDTKKRPEQGRIAAEFCDIVFLADEDPRGEVPMELLEDIAAGCVNADRTRAGGKPVVREDTLFLIPDRPAAIRKAFSIAREGDIVLLLGKAHENSIIYKDYVMPYDEISEAEKALDELLGKQH